MIDRKITTKIAMIIKIRQPVINNKGTVASRIITHARLRTELSPKQAMDNATTSLRHRVLYPRASSNEVNPLEKYHKREPTQHLYHLYNKQPHKPPPIKPQRWAPGQINNNNQKYPWSVKTDWLGKLQIHSPIYPSTLKILHPDSKRDNSVTTRENF